jgi:mono/diheme cytochrome c family protein
MRRRTRSGLLVAVLAVTAALARPPVPAGAGEQYNPGKELYLKHCQSCHGRNATGDGPLASLLIRKPPDLTQLAKNAGGEFPFLRTMEIIEGKTDVRAHGDSEMPVWGLRFRAEASKGVATEAEIRARLLWLTEYLREVQEPVPTGRP